MGLAELVAVVMLALLIGWLGIVLLATFRQLDVEAHKSASERERP